MRGVACCICAHILRSAAVGPRIPGRHHLRHAYHIQGADHELQLWQRHTGRPGRPLLLSAPPHRAQTSSTKLQVEAFGKAPLEIEADISIKGVYAYGDFVGVWSGRSVSVFELIRDRTASRNGGSFKSEASQIAIFDQSIFCAEGGSVNVRNMHGASKQQLLFNDNEGEVTLMDLNGKYIVAATNAGVVKAWDLSRREVRQHGLTKRCLFRLITPSGSLSITASRARSTR